MPSLTCEKLLFGGLGLCRTDEGIVFATGLLPGETGLCVPAGKRGGVAHFQLETLEETSPDRREPFCDYFGRCGGCTWQHLRYEAQVEAKANIFAEQMARLGGIPELPEIECIIGPETAYRIRAQFQLDHRKKRVGFHRAGSNELIAVEHCPLLSEGLNALLSHPKPLLTAVKGKKISLIDTAEGVVSSPVVRGLTEKSATHHVGAVQFSLRGNAFFQSNRYLTTEMAGWLCGELHGKKLLDLFGGTGLFSLFHGVHFEETLLVELERSMAREAQKNFRANGLLNGRAIASSAEQFFADNEEIFDVVIVDPPRPGLGKSVREGLGKLAPKQLLYISCNPSTQARDVGYLVRECGYRIERAALFDLYPNSYHMETGLLLVRT